VHEYSIVQALIDRVAAEARARGAIGVYHVEVAIGELAGVECELLATAFETFRAGTVCAGAELAISRVPARWRCPRCAAAPAAGGPLRCPACGVGLRLEGGDEILLERIEMEVA
jgi:hydrogenase nickel incorporation protein HypA/HybF